MEKLLSLLETVSTTWLSPGSTTWAMDMMFAFVCGLGLFHLLLPYLQFNPPSPPVEKSKNIRKVKRERSKTRKKIRTMKAFRGIRKAGKKKQKQTEWLLPFLQRFYQLLREDASGKMLKPASAKAQQPPSQPVEDACAGTLSLLGSSAPLRNRLLPEGPILSPGLLNSPVSVESQSSLCASQPPETWIIRGCLSPDPRALSSTPSHAPDPLACPPSTTDPSLVLSQCDRKAVPLDTTSQRVLPSPVPNTLGLDHSSSPIAGHSWYQVAARAWCQSNSSNCESLQEHLSVNPPKASLWDKATHRQIETEGPSFITPDVQKLLELQISKIVRMKVCKEKEGSDNPSNHLGNTLQSLSIKQGITTARPFWRRNSRPKQFPDHQQLPYQDLGDNINHKCSQLFWGLPFLHSESLVSAVKVSDSSLNSSPSILFNGIPTYIPVHVHTKVPPQLFSTQPLIHHLVQPQPQPLSPTLPWSQPPPVAGIQTQVHLPSPPPVQPCHSPPIKAFGVSYPTTSKSISTVPAAVQGLERHLLKKHLESRSNLPPMVERSLEAFYQHTSNSWASKNQRSLVKVPAHFISCELQEQLEQHLEKRFTQHQCKLPLKIHLTLDLIKSQDKCPGAGQAEDKYEPSKASILGDKSNQDTQSSTVTQVWKNSFKDRENCLGKSLKDRHRSPEDSSEKVLEAISKIDPGIRQMISSSDSGNVSMDAGEKKIEGVLKANLSISEDNGPLDICLNEFPRGDILASPEITETNMKSVTEPSLNQCVSYKNISENLAFLDPGTQQVLETHLKRSLVRHRWSLPLKILKTMRLTLKGAPSLPPPQSSEPSLVFWDSKDDSIVKIPSILGEPLQKDQEVITQIGSTMQNPLPSQPFQSLRGTQSDGSSKALPTVTEENLPSQPHTYTLVGRRWHRDMVLGSRISNLETSPSQGMGWYEPQESEHEALRELYHMVSVREISVASQSPSTRDTKELEKTEEEESCDWTFTMRDRDMENPQPNNECLKNLDSLEASESPTPSKTISQTEGDSGLSTPYHSTTGVVLQDCTTGMFLEDCAPGVLLAADTLASQASHSSFKSMSTTSKSTPQHRYPFLSREEHGPNIPTVSEPWASHIFDPTDKKEVWESPRQNVRPSRVRPTKVCRSSTPDSNSSSPADRTFGNRIKNFILSIFLPKGKVQEDSLRKVKASSASTQSQGSVLGKIFTSSQVAETKDLMTTVGWILEEKMGVHHACAPRKNLHKEPPQALVSRHASHDMRTIEPKRIQKNRSSVQGNPKINSEPSTNKWMRSNVNNQVQHLVSYSSHWQHRAQVQYMPGQCIHCPRHCLCRNVMSRKGVPVSDLPW